MFHFGFPKKLYSVGRIVALISSFALMISSFIPWGVASDMSGKTIMITGLEGDGKITVVLGALAVVLVILEKAPHWLVLMLGLLATAIGGIDLYAMYAATSNVIGYVGYGLHITTIAGIGVVVGSLIEILSRKK